MARPASLPPRLAGSVFSTTPARYARSWESTRTAPGWCYGEASRAVFNLNRDGPALAFTGTDGALRAILALVKDGPGLVLFDSVQRARAQLTVRAGSGTAAVLDADGTTTWQAPATPR